jgi:hypothetical protein
MNLQLYFPHLQKYLCGILYRTCPRNSLSSHEIRENRCCKNHDLPTGVKNVLLVFYMLFIPICKKNR